MIDDEDNLDAEDKIIEMLGFCYCGNPENIVHDLYRYLIYAEKKKLFPDKYLIYAYIADKYKLTDHFTSVYGAWLTRKGEETLKELKEFYKKGKE